VLPGALVQAQQLHCDLVEALIQIDLNYYCSQQVDRNLELPNSQANHRSAILDMPCRQSENKDIAVKHV
jgi:hypothetical protein